MVDHLQHPAGDRLRRQGERAEDDEAEVGDRRVGDEAFEVALHRRHDRPVGDADDGEREQQGPGPLGGLGEQVQPEAQQPVGAELEHHAGEDHRAGGGRLGVGVGEPGVERDHRHLDGEGDGEGEEQPAPGGRRERRLLGEGDEVERDLADAVAASEQHGGEDADEHERRAEHREEEELRRRVDPVAVAPAADEEVHRHEDDLEEDEEDEQVEAEERAHHPGLEQEHPGEVGLLVVVRVGREERQREEDAGEHDEQQRDAVDAEVPGDAPVLDPLVLGHELEARPPRCRRRRAATG